MDTHYEWMLREQRGPSQEAVDFVKGWGPGEDMPAWMEKFTDENGVPRMDWIADAME